MRKVLVKIKRRVERLGSRSPLRPSAAAMNAARADSGDRLLVRPVFVLSSIRSGSTLLRVILNTHSQIHAPHELHLRNLGVTLRGKYVKQAMDELGLASEQLEYLLWDRLLHREMMRHQKTVLVNKTPSDALIWRRIVACWPEARFIYLFRHPAAITDSWSRARKTWTRDQVAEDVLPYMVAMEEARRERPGLELRYEDLTRDPEKETRRVCEFIGIPWEPAMLDYRGAHHGPFRGGLGDWSAKIKSGEVHPVERLPAPEEIPPALVDISTKWGYLEQSV